MVCQAEVDQADLMVGIFDHHIFWFYISMEIACLVEISEG
jgi:hypothetical protein